jgi:hypothetical protein
MTDARFRADSGSVIVTLSRDERRFLSQVLDLLADVGKIEDDPAEARLAVPVYLDNPEANDEWWRLMGEELDISRRSDRDLYRRVTTKDGPTMLDENEADAFLRVLNEGRLAFAARIGLEVEDDHDWLPELEMQALDYLGWVLEELTAELSKGL